MTKTEYIATIEADLTAANALCAELRTLRNFKKIAKTIPDADKMVTFDVLDKTHHRQGRRAAEAPLRPRQEPPDRQETWRKSRPLRRARPPLLRLRSLLQRKPTRLTQPPPLIPRLISLQGKRLEPGLRPPRARRILPRRNRASLSSLRLNTSVGDKGAKKGRWPRSRKTTALPHTGGAGRTRLLLHTRTDRKIQGGTRK